MLYNNTKFRRDFPEEVKAKRLNKHLYRENVQFVRPALLSCFGHCLTKYSLHCHLRAKVFRPFSRSACSFRSQWPNSQSSYWGDIVDCGTFDPFGKRSNCIAVWVIERAIFSQHRIVVDHPVAKFLVPDWGK